MDCDWEEMKKVVEDLYHLESDENFTYSSIKKEKLNDENLSEEEKNELNRLKEFPILLNGDICFQKDIDHLNSFGNNVKGVMIGSVKG